MMWSDDSAYRKSMNDEWNFPICEAICLISDDAYRKFQGLGNCVCLFVVVPHVVLEMKLLEGANPRIATWHLPA